MNASFFLEVDALSAKNGWMDCWLIGSDGKRNQLGATSVFPPFKDLLAFARALATNTLPFAFFWDEEGHGAKFEATPLEKEAVCFHLRINHDGEMIVDQLFERMQVVHGLLAVLREVALYCPRADSEWELPFFLIEKFERELVQNFSPVSPSALKTVHFVFSQYGGFGGVRFPGFTLWIEDYPLLYLALEDNLHLWEAWFELLQKVRRGTLPLEAVFREKGEAAEFFALFFGGEQTYIFHANPLPDTHAFHFQIEALYTATEPERKVLVLDAPLNRHQFVDAFTQAIQHFLTWDYSAFIQGDVGRLDLRQFPWDTLAL